MLELSPKGFTSTQFNKVSIGGIERTISRQVDTVSGKAVSEGRASVSS